MVTIQTKKLKKHYSTALKRISIGRKRLVQLIDTYPLRSFIVTLGVMILIIIAGNLLRSPKPQTEDEQVVKDVSVFSIGHAPTSEFIGTVEVDGVIKITAQSPGVVQYVSTPPGTSVYKGQVLIGMSTNYQGGTIPSVSRQIAQESYDLANENYPVQSELIETRRHIAELVGTQADELRNITNDSIDDTKAAIAANDEIVSTLDGQIASLEASNVGGTNDALILQSKQARAGVLSGLASLRTALRNAEYAASSKNEPSELVDITRETTLKQLDMEKRALDLSLEVSKLNLTIARISESLMYPASPRAGVVERVYVYPGQAVNPGQLLATVVASSTITHVVVPVSADVARHVSRLEPSTIMFNSQAVESVPSYISTQPTEGNLYSVQFVLPDETVIDPMPNGSSVSVSLPIGDIDSTTAVPYVPIDAVYQTQTTALVYVAVPSDGDVYSVESREIELGDVFGSFVSVHAGLSGSDQIIIDRTVIAGDIVSITE